jgi:hypothetical protein
MGIKAVGFVDTRSTTLLTTVSMIFEINLSEESLSMIRSMILPLYRITQLKDPERTVEKPLCLLVQYQKLMASRLSTMSKREQHPSVAQQHARPSVLLPVVRHIHVSYRSLFLLLNFTNTVG